MISQTIKPPKNFKPKKFTNAKDAVAYAAEIYNHHTHFLCERFQQFVKEVGTDFKPTRACYPYVKIESETAHRQDSRLSYGFIPKPGSYATTLTALDMFTDYYETQIGLLIESHDKPIEIGVSETPLPLHFALGDDFHLEKDLSATHIERLPVVFDVPNLDVMDDEIANGSFRTKDGEPMPLALFTAPRVDLSLQRLKHYCGSAAGHFQNFVIFTNYQFYIDEFIDICHAIMAPTDDPVLKRERAEYEAFVEPGNKVTVNKNIDDLDMSDEEGDDLKRLPQMPAYHLKRGDHSGITMINIGVGPSNAKTITDHVAVLRPPSAAASTQDARR